MPWVKLDDGFTDHPKIAALSDSAFRTFVTALCYCNKNLTDGFVPALIARQISTPKGLKELCAVGVVEQDGKDFRVHDYTDYQPKRENVIAEREAAKERMNRVRANKALRSPDVRANNERTSHNPVPDPDPISDPSINQRKVIDLRAGQESGVRHRLWDVYTQLTMRLTPSPVDEQQFELWEANGLTIEQIDGALTDTVAARPERAWPYFKTVLGDRIAKAAVPEKPKPPTLTAAEVQALREARATR